jgi:hypothetical protein
VEQYLRDSKIFSIYEGTNHIQAMDLVGRKLGQGGGANTKAFLGDIQKFIDANKAHPVLGDSVAQLQRAHGAVGQCVMQFLQWFQGGQMQNIPLNSERFLEIMGELAIGWLLLEQAALGLEKIDGLSETHPDRAFYTGKKFAAFYFAQNVLPRAVALLGGDDAPQHEGRGAAGLGLEHPVEVGAGEAVLLRAVRELGRAEAGVHVAGGAVDDAVPGLHRLGGAVGVLQHVCQGRVGDGVVAHLPDALPQRCLGLLPAPEGREAAPEPRLRARLSGRPTNSLLVAREGLFRAPDAQERLAVRHERLGPSRAVLTGAAEEGLGGGGVAPLPQEESPEHERGSGVGAVYLHRASVCREGVVGALCELEELSEPEVGVGPVGQGRSGGAVRGLARGDVGAEALGVGAGEEQLAVVGQGRGGGAELALGQGHALPHEVGPGEAHPATRPGGHRVAGCLRRAKVSLVEADAGHLPLRGLARGGVARGGPKGAQGLVEAARAAEGASEAHEAGRVAPGCAEALQGRLLSRSSGGREDEQCGEGEALHGRWGLQSVAADV